MNENLRLSLLRNRTFDEIAVGDSESIERTLTSIDLQLYAVMCGDDNPHQPARGDTGDRSSHGALAARLHRRAAGRRDGDRRRGGGRRASRAPATLDAAALCKMADRGQISGGVLDGPLAFDNAVSMAAARIKGIESPGAGQADVLVVPDLDSGNMLAKQLEHMGDAASAGIVIGARVPIILTSRADSCESRIATCAIALLLARHYETSPP
jgi:phosphotransacetylase